MGILFPEQAVGAEDKALKKMSAAIILAEENPIALKKACEQCTTKNCSESKHLKESCGAHCGCDDGCSSCNPPAPTPPTDDDKPRKPIHPEALKAKKDKIDAIKKTLKPKTDAIKDAYKALAKAPKQERQQKKLDLEEACKTGCVSDNCSASPGFGRFCEKRCSYNPCPEEDEEGTKKAVQRLEQASSKKKQQVCEQECKKGLCGKKPDLAKACSKVCGVKYAKACHVMDLSTDLLNDQSENKISDKYKKAAQAILDAPTDKEKDKRCSSGCGRGLALQGGWVNPCAEDVNFAKFCIANCKRKTVIKCSQLMDQNELKSMKFEEHDAIYRISKDNRDSAAAIEKLAAILDKNKTNPAPKFDKNKITASLIKACNNKCTKSACSNDEAFQNFCKDKCPAHTIVKCGHTSEMKVEGTYSPAKVESLKKLFNHFKAVGDARKNDPANQGKKANYYAELATELEKACQPRFCKQNDDLAVGCSCTFKSIKSENSTILKGTYGFRKPTVLKLPPECMPKSEPKNCKGWPVSP